jgi:hypothetical protein
MKTLMKHCAQATLVVALATIFSACDDDLLSNDNAAGSGGGAGARATGGGGNKPGASAGSGGSAVSTGDACFAGASRFPQVSEGCLGCVCETVSSCGTACQELLICTLSNCMDSLSDNVELVSCSLRTCAAEAASPGATDGLTEAIAALAGCDSVCPSGPALGEDAGVDDAGSDDAGSDDAGVDDIADAGL